MAGVLMHVGAIWNQQPDEVQIMKLDLFMIRLWRPHAKGSSRPREGRTQGIAKLDPCHA